LTITDIYRSTVRRFGVSKIVVVEKLIVSTKIGISTSVFNTDNRDAVKPRKAAS